VDPDLFAADLEAKPRFLRELSELLTGADPWSVLPMGTRFVLVGMGSSHYAASIAAARLRARGVNAVAELASSDLLPAPDGHTVVIAVSAGGGSRETASAVQWYAGHCPIVLLTNRLESPLVHAVDAVVPMSAGDEQGGVACRTFQHTLVMLLALEARLASPSLDLPTLVTAAARATSDLLDRRAQWLPELTGLLVGPDGIHVVAPARRLSSSQQSALMLREGPRIPATASETGDWNHVDVYLTKSTDYRLLLLTGSPWEEELLKWTNKRGSTVVAVGADAPGAAMSLRYEGDDNDDVRLLTETLVAELLAASLWRSQSS